MQSVNSLSSTVSKLLWTVKPVTSSCTHAHIHVHIDTNVCTWTHKHTCTHTHTHTHTHSPPPHTHTHMYVHTCTHTHECAHTHTHIHTHTQWNPKKAHTEKKTKGFQCMHHSFTTDNFSHVMKKLSGSLSRGHPQFAMPDTITAAMGKK